MTVYDLVLKHKGEELDVEAFDEELNKIHELNIGDREVVNWSIGHIIDENGKVKFWLEIVIK